MLTNGKSAQKTAQVVGTAELIEDPRPAVRVLLSGKLVKDCYRTDSGNWSIVIEASRLTESERMVIDRLFPHVSEQVYTLLDKEALIAAMVRHE